MANSMTGKPVRGAWAAVLVGIALAIMSVSVMVSLAQQPDKTSQPPQPPRGREVLRKALDNYKGGDYELAAQQFSQATSLQNELTTAERKDLQAFIQKNNEALAAQREGKMQLQGAEEAVRQGKTADASSLVKSLNSNQYLSAKDRQALAKLNQSLRMPGTGVEPAVENTEKALLAAAREAINRGKLELAEAYNAQAKKVAPLVHFPGADTPAKVEREIAAARAKVTGSFEKKDNNPIKTVSKMVWPKDDKKDTVVIQEGPPLKDTASAGGQSPSVRQTTFPPQDAAASKALAKKLVKEGYQALEANDPDTARRKALQAKELNAGLEWWEENPNKLLEDIQRRSAVKGGAPAGKTVKPADVQSFIKEGRKLLQQERFEEADKVCAQAEASPTKGWGLFDDSPAKLRADLQKAWSARLMTEARKQYGMGNLKDAKAKALEAQRVHGPYTIWDMGDRPQRLIDEIDRVESKGGSSRVDPKKGPGNAVAQAQANTPGASANSKVPVVPPTPFVSGTAQATNKNRAVALVREARELQKKGMLLEAQAKAIEAQQLRVPFAFDEDNPAAVLVSLAAQGERTVDQLLQHATDHVQNHPADSQRFQKAEADINSARQLARALQLDPARIEQRAQWLAQSSAVGGVSPIAVAPLTLPKEIIQTGAQLPVPPAPFEAPANRNRLLGLEKLDKARLELNAGNLAVARRLAEEASNPTYGIQEEAARVLNSIEADEHNHKINDANKNVDIGIEWYKRGDYRRAMAILQSIDMKLVSPDKARQVGEVMQTAPMQPQRLQPVDARELNTAPGIATATDQGDGGLTQFRALQEVQFQQLGERGRDAQRTAMELFKNGRKQQAVEVLSDYLDELKSSPFDAQRIALLKQPVERRVQQYRTILAQETLQNQAVNLRWDETKIALATSKTQEQVAEQMKICRERLKEGKYKEALAAVTKARELDPDSIAVNSTYQIVQTKIAIQDYEKGNAQSEEIFRRELNPSEGPYVNGTTPVAFDAERNKIARTRKTGETGIFSPLRDPKEREIERKLYEPITVSFKDTPLHQVIEDLNYLSGVPIVAQKRALDEANISLDVPLSLSVDKISLRSALNILLDQVKLTYQIKNQTLTITTKEEAKGQKKLVTYPVADLVVPVENHPTPAVADMYAVLNHLKSASGMVAASSSPMLTPTGLGGGQSASSPGSGVGSNFAVNGQYSSPVNPLPSRAPGENLQAALIDLIEKCVAPDTWDKVGGQGNIQYYPLGMALVVNQTQEVQEGVTDLLRALRRLLDLEVSIEMRLVAVSESFFERIGVDFNVNFKSPTSAANQLDLINGQFTPFGQVNSQFQGIKAITGLTPAGTLTPDLGIPVRTGSFGMSIPPFGGYPGTLGADGGLSLGMAFLSDIQVFMFLEAAQGDRRLNVMQAPKITVFNGQTATISVNDFQFFLTGVSIQQASGQIFFSPNNQPFPLGVNMTVTPVVSADRRFVRLNLTPTLTNLASTTVPLIPIQIPVPQLLEGPGNASTQLGQPAIFQMFFQQPAFTTITVNTTVNVPDGGTVLLGGLKTMSEGRNEFGPPILSKIPYLSRLFRNTAYGREGQSLMIMVTPRIIINEEEEAIFTNEIQPFERP